MYVDIICNRKYICCPNMWNDLLILKAYNLMRSWQYFAKKIWKKFESNIEKDHVENLAFWKIKHNRDIFLNFTLFTQPLRSGRIWHMFNF